MISYYPTKHAVAAMTERNVSWAEVLWVLENPDVTYRSNTGPHANKDSEIRQRGSLYCVVATKPSFDRHDAAKELPLYAVITVGLRSTQVWNNEDARKRAVVTTETADTVQSAPSPATMDLTKET